MKHRILYTLVLLFATMQMQAQTYTYDNNNRLTKVVYGNGVMVSYTYDKLGNRLSKKVTSGFLKGDANGDGSVTISDAVAIVNKILGNPSGNFNEAASDVSGDGEITITDAVGVVNIILGNGGSSAP